MKILFLNQFDEGEYNTGRLIGMLERIFVFLFVLFNQYTAIGFILAAKGVARFPILRVILLQNMF
ncbi:MAG TPA: hypothetical protein VF181_08160 [Balneolaceae bacterium]